MFRSISISSVIILFLTASTAFAQSFSIQLNQEQAVTAVPLNGAATIAAEAVGLPSVASITISYRGNSSAVIGSIDRSGSNEFSITSPGLPVTLSPNQQVTLSVRFVPGTPNRAVYRIQVNYREGAAAGDSSFAINLAGVTPDLVVSYLLPGGNATAVGDGGRIVFAATPIGSTVAAAISVTNRGSSAGTVKGIAVSGSTFAAAGLPLPPVTLNAGEAMRFSLNFTPQQREAQAGSLKIDHANRGITIALEGTGASATLSYEVIRDVSEDKTAPGQTIPLGETAVGEKTSVSVRIRNSGNADAVISSVSVLGTGYQLSELPFLPVTLPPQAAVAFTLTFAPTQPGRIPGRLRVGSDTFELSATGLGAALTYSAVIGGAGTSIALNGSILFSPIEVGKASTAQFIMTNGGTTAATINSIFITGAGSRGFVLSGVPELPLVLDPGKTAGFRIDFSPVTVGVSEAALRVGAAAFSLVGSSTAPPPLPPMVLEGPAGAIQPLQQPAYTLSLAEPYPLNLTGTLTLRFNSEVFTNDATIQFATGGRTVAFAIPANTTRAVFINNEPQIRLQTGSVAGTVTVSAAVGTEGGIDLTPGSPPSATLSVPQAAPELTNVQLAGKTANSFTLLVTGYSPGRSISRLELQVTAASGQNVTNSRLTLNVESAFLSWYQNAQSQQFGSLFTATVPVTLELAAGTSASLVDAIQSVTVSAGNNIGTSSGKTIELR